MILFYFLKLINSICFIHTDHLILWSMWRTLSKNRNSMTFSFWNLFHMCWFGFLFLIFVFFIFPWNFVVVWWIFMIVHMPWQITLLVLVTYSKSYILQIVVLNCFFNKHLLSFLSAWSSFKKLTIHILYNKLYIRFLKLMMCYVFHSIIIPSFVFFILQFGISL